MTKKTLYLLLIILILQFINNSYSNVNNVDEFAKKIFIALKNKNYKEYLKYHIVKENNLKKIINNLKSYLNEKYNKRKIYKAIKSISNNIIKHRKKILTKAKTDFLRAYNSLQGLWKLTRFFNAGISNVKYESGLIKTDIKIYFTLGRKFLSITLEGVIMSTKKALFLCDGITNVDFLFRIIGPVENEVEPLMH